MASSSVGSTATEVEALLALDLARGFGGDGDGSYMTVLATEEVLLLALDLARGLTATGASIVSSSDARLSGRPRGSVDAAGIEGGSSPEEFQGTRDGDGLLRALAGGGFDEALLLRPRRCRGGGSGVPMSKCGTVAGIVGTGSGSGAGGGGAGGGGGPVP